MPAGVFTGSTTFALPADAASIKATIVEVAMDDTDAYGTINGTLAFDFRSLSPDTVAFAAPADIDVSSLIHGGDNTLWGSVTDRYGTASSLQITVKGTYEAAACP